MTDHFMQPIMDKLRDLRKQAEARDITFMTFELKQNHDGEKTEWVVYMARGSKNTEHVKAPGLDDAFDEACRRIDWERDVAMKLLPASPAPPPSLFRDGVDPEFREEVAVTEADPKGDIPF